MHISLFLFVSCTSLFLFFDAAGKSGCGLLPANSPVFRRCQVRQRRTGALLAPPKGRENRTPKLFASSQICSVSVFARRGSVPPAHCCKSAHRASCGATGADHAVLSVPIGSVIGVPPLTALSALHRQMSRFPLLLRKNAEMPFSLRVSTLCRIFREILLGVIPAFPTGSINSTSSVGVPINSVLPDMKEQSRGMILSPRISG